MDESNKKISIEIQQAISAKNLGKLHDLITSDLNRLSWTTPLGTYLHLAASDGHLEVVKFLVDQGIDINRRAGISDGSAIARAAARGHAEIVSFLIQHGAELDVSQSERNPLFSAIYGRSLGCVKILLEAGIDARVRYTGQRMKNMDAVGHAEERGEKEIAALIRDFLEKHPEKTEEE